MTLSGKGDISLKRTRPSALRRFASWWTDDDRPAWIAVYVGYPIQRFVCVLEDHNLFAWNEDPRKPLYARCAWCESTYTDRRIEKVDGFWKVIE